MKSEWSRLLDDAGMLGLTPEEAEETILKGFLA